MPIEANRFYTATEVARQMFGKDVSWFYAMRKKLIRQEGFPQPISQFGQPRWSGTALLMWAVIPRAAPSNSEEQDDRFSQLLDYRTDLMRKAPRRRHA